MGEHPPNKNSDDAELAKFVFQEDRWWDLNGDFQALHDINPIRLAYIQNRAGIGEKTVLDVGCGGGILAEAMAKAGGRVTGIDLSRPALTTAKAHAHGAGLAIDYRYISAERLAESSPNYFQFVTCMELIEHVPRPKSLIKTCAHLAKPGGDLFFATVNRTLLAYLLVILASEYVLGIIKKGMHHYEKFVQPQELKKWADDAGLELQDLTGLRYIPIIRKSGLCRSVSMNYMIHFKKR